MVEVQHNQNVVMYANVASGGTVQLLVPTGVKKVVNNKRQEAENVVPQRSGEGPAVSALLGLLNAVPRRRCWNEE
jgi:hypothetical protein